MQFKFGSINRLAIALAFCFGCVFLASCGGDEEMASDLNEQVLPPGDKHIPSDVNSDVPNDGDTEIPEGNVDKKPVALSGLPDFTAGYDQWLKLNAEPIPPTDGPDPHNGTKNVYVNQERADIAPGGQQVFPYPNDSIVVKESTRPGKDFIGLVAIMRKTKGINPTHNDWVFEEYVRNAEDVKFSKIADGAVCWNCHSGVADTDYVFTPLE